jgi:hypothetical protein
MASKRKAKVEATKPGGGDTEKKAKNKDETEKEIPVVDVADDDVTEHSGDEKEEEAEGEKDEKKKKQKKKTTKKGGAVKSKSRAKKKAQPKEKAKEAAAAPVSRELKALAKKDGVNHARGVSIEEIKARYDEDGLMTQDSYDNFVDHVEKFVSLAPTVRNNLSVVESDTLYAVTQLGRSVLIGAKAQCRMAAVMEKLFAVAQTTPAEPVVLKATALLQELKGASVVPTERAIDRLRKQLEAEEKSVPVPVVSVGTLANGGDISDLSDDPAPPNKKKNSRPPVKKASLPLKRSDSTVLAPAASPLPPPLVVTSNIAASDDDF